MSTLPNVRDLLEGHITLELESIDMPSARFFSCQNPQRLQALADSLGQRQIEAFLKKWLDRLPMQLSTRLTLI